MPCYSTIQTKMTNADHLEAALKALGYTFMKGGITRYTMVAEKDGDMITFTRPNTTIPFSVSGDTDNLSAIGRKYAEVGVKNWAKSRGYLVEKNDGINMTLNRRTY